MSLIQSIRRKLCAFVGHGQLHIIEEYSRKSAVRQFITAGTRTIYAPHMQHDIEAKWRCVKCGAVSVGEVQQRHWMGAKV